MGLYSAPVPTSLEQFDSLMDQKPTSREHRFHALCPYFAMFPPKFAREQILTYTKRGELVLDPFSGRGTTALEAILNGRRAIGLDINPVAALVAQAKVQGPTLKTMLHRLAELEADWKTIRRSNQPKLDRLPMFFKYAYSEQTLKQILFLRSTLRWKNSKTDRFLCALVLGHLHGESNKSDSYLSNQMPHTIAPKPNYAIRFWQEKEFEPPLRDVFELLRCKAKFRLGDGIPKGTALIKCGDARQVYKRFRSFRGSVSAAITSPPYLDVTNFEEDQWLRLWFLGGKPYPTYNQYSQDDRHSSREKYFSFLRNVWRGTKPLMKTSAILVCRIGTRHISFEEMVVHLSKTISDTWQHATLVGEPRVTDLKNNQTDIFHPTATGCKQEYDFVFRLRTRARSARATNKILLEAAVRRDISLRRRNQEMKMLKG